MYSKHHRIFLCAVLAFTLQGVLTAQTPAAKPAKVSRYTEGVALNFAALVPQPPLRESAAGEADLRAVHLAQDSRTPAQVKAAQRDDHEESVFAFDTVLGPRLRSEDLPLLTAFSLHLREESSVINPALKKSFNRPRPFVADSTITPVCDRAATNSYPSGHAMVGYLEAQALAQMIPEQSDAIMKRADDYAHNRIVCGVHYPSDIEASHVIASALFGVLASSASFQKELAASRAEVRQHLQLVP